MIFTNYGNYYANFEIGSNCVTFLLAGHRKVVTFNPFAPCEPLSIYRTVQTLLLHVVPWISRKVQIWTFKICNKIKWLRILLVLTILTPKGYPSHLRRQRRMEHTTEEGIMPRWTLWSIYSLPFWNIIIVQMKHNQHQLWLRVGNVGFVEKMDSDHGSPCTTESCMFDIHESKKSLVWLYHCSSAFLMMRHWILQDPIFSFLIEFGQ